MNEKKKKEIETLIRGLKSSQFINSSCNYSSCCLFLILLKVVAFLVLDTLSWSSLLDLIDQRVLTEWFWDLKFFQPASSPSTDGSYHISSRH